jgi:hypothetical protein
MNKKQLVVVWIMGIYVSVFFVLRETIYPIIKRRGGPDLSLLPDRYLWDMIFSQLRRPVSVLLISVLIIGGLLIYILRDKK